MCFKAYVKGKLEMPQLKESLSLYLREGLIAAACLGVVL